MIYKSATYKSGEIGLDIRIKGKNETKILQIWKDIVQVLKIFNLC